MQAGRDRWWHDLMTDASPDCPAEQLDSEHPLFILYTSGSTGKPKGVLHTTAGYLLGVSLTHRWVFDLREEDTYWCTADLGWVFSAGLIVVACLLAYEHWLVRPDDLARVNLAFFHVNAVISVGLLVVALADMWVRRA